MRQSRKLLLLAAALAIPLGPQATDGWPGENETPADSAKVTLQQRLDRYERRLAELEKEVRELREARARERRKAEVEKLLASARAMAARTPESDSALTTLFVGGERKLQALNPEISVTGDFTGRIRNTAGSLFGSPDYGEPADRQFALREAEFHIVSPLDPYTRAKFFLGVPGTGSLHVGEAYMEWLNLPGNLQAKIGKFRNQFGVLNRWHTHALPQVDRPRVLGAFLGEEGLSGMGVSANWLMPRLWAHVNELDVEVVYGGGGPFFNESGTDRWVAVAHLKNYFDLSANAYLELGFTGATGHHDPDARWRSYLWGADVSYKWQPAGRAKYRTVEVRGEVLVGRRKTPGGDETVWGFYSFVENKLGPRWWIGARVDYVQSPENREEREWGLSPHLTWWQSEFVYLRLQLRHLVRKLAADERALMVQAVWSMGPHKHEAY